MDATQSHIVIYNVFENDAENFAFDFDTRSDDLLTELVPDLKEWGEVGWMELSGWEYDENKKEIYMLLETKRLAPREWLKAASRDVDYFHNRLITMITISKNETWVGGFACMDGEVLQDKTLVELSSDIIGRHYDEEYSQYDIEDLDRLLWDPAEKFTAVCQKFYIGDEQND